MSNKVIYSLKIHIALRMAGFEPVFEMPNPRKPQYTCWIYEDTPELEEVFDRCIREMEAGRDEE
jgi:hypothetical protein